MRYSVGLLNLALGAVYTSYGLMTLADMKKGWRTSGFSHFGAAWVAMAFTCGPHHLIHGAHVTFEGQGAGSLDLLAVLVGAPAGITWFLLRVEAVTGGRGDRHIDGTPLWVDLLPVLSGTYLVVLMAAIVGLAGGFVGVPSNVMPNLALVVLYLAIGAVLLRTQLDNHAVTGGWSLSGLSLSVVFPTCAVMHGVWAVYRSAGRYESDWHIWVNDVLSIPAAMYFLWVVWSLYVGRIRDWNRAAADTTRRTAEADVESPLNLQPV